MKSQNELKIGKANITNFLIDGSITDRDEEELTNLEQKIIRLGGPYGENCLSFELANLSELRKRAAEIRYPQLNPEFLTMSNEVNEIVHDNKGRKYSLKHLLPRFSVYSLYGNNSFGLDMGLEYAGCIFSKDSWDISVRFLNESLPGIITEYLVKSLGFPGECRHRSKNLKEFRDLPKDIVNKYKDDNRKRFVSFLNIPFSEDVKEKIKEYEEIFKKNELYVIAETEAENWNIYSLSTDPLIVGCIEDQLSALVGFKATPLEQTIKIVYNLKK